MSWPMFTGHLQDGLRNADLRPGCEPSYGAGADCWPIDESATARAKKTGAVAAPVEYGLACADA